ncbi:ParE family toxin-like protein [Enterobacter cloacae]
MQMADFSSRQQVSPAVRLRAQQLFYAVCSGQKLFRRLAINGKGYLKIDVGPFWRILSKDGGHQWWLMDHETYNREIRR